MGDDPQDDYTCKRCGADCNSRFWSTGLCRSCRQDDKDAHADYLNDVAKERRHEKD